DDYKMMKQICFDVTSLAGLVFGVLAASISINEEIEGRTAVTLMSKPVTRRQFLIGKYVGIMFAALSLWLLLGWFMIWALHAQPNINPIDQVVDQMPMQASNALEPSFEKMSKGDSFLFMIGVRSWTADALADELGVLLGFGRVMVMLAIAATLATRM